MHRRQGQCLSKLLITIFIVNLKVISGFVDLTLAWEHNVDHVFILGVALLAQALYLKASHEVDVWQDLEYVHAHKWNGMEKLKLQDQKSFDITLLFVS